jgi:cytoskeletal protein CcmA (bactofilin family)
MDPSKSQSEDNNDAHSLEGTDTVVEGGQTPNTSTVPLATDATGNKGAAPPPSAKTSLLKRFWQRFNIYLLLFVFIVLVAIVVTIIFFVKSQNSDSSKDKVDTQNLSADALKQLANSDVTVGNASQVLKVESNAIFSGAVLLRSDLEVAGDLKIGGDLQLPGITVAGTSRFSELQADNVSIASSAAVQGTLTVKNGLNVSGSSTFGGPLTAASISTNSLQLGGNLVLTKHLTAGGPIVGLDKGTALGSGGTASVSGSDTAGTITINTGGGPGAGCFVTVTFTTKFDGVPHVIVTPIGSGAAGLNYYINRGTTSFSVCVTNAAPAGQTFGFDYIVIG